MYPFSGLIIAGERVYMNMGYYNSWSDDNEKGRLQKTLTLSVKINILQQVRLKQPSDFVTSLNLSSFLGIRLSPLMRVFNTIYFFVI